MKIRILGDEQGRSTLLSDCCEGRVNFGFRTSANNIYLSFEQGRCFLQLADLKIRIALDVRFGSKADMMCSKLDVRFYLPKADIPFGEFNVRFVPMASVHREPSRWVCIANGFPGRGYEMALLPKTASCLESIDP